MGKKLVPRRNRFLFSLIVTTLVIITLLFPTTTTMAISVNIENLEGKSITQGETSEFCINIIIETDEMVPIGKVRVTVEGPTSFQYEFSVAGGERPYLRLETPQSIIDTTVYDYGHYYGYGFFYGYGYGDFPGHGYYPTGYGYGFYGPQRLRWKATLISTENLPTGQYNARAEVQSNGVWWGGTPTQVTFSIQPPYVPPPPPPPDTEPPTVSNLQPQPESTVTTTTPTIMANYTDNKAVDMETVRLYLNETDITPDAKVTSTGVSYTPIQPLTNRTTYTVKASVADTSGNQATEEWNFTILVLLPPPPPKPAEFKVSNLTITPSEVNASEPVQITVKVSNVGEETGSYDLTLWVNGLVEAFETVTLDGGRSVVLTFTVTKEELGTYMVEVDGLTGTFPVKELPPAPAEFQLSDLTISPAEVQEGETVAVSVKVTNIGEQASGYNVTLWVNNTVEDFQTVTLDGGESTTVSFSLTKDAGEYSVEVDGLNGPFNVTTPPPPPPPPRFLWEYVIAAIIIIIIVLALILWWWRRRSKY